MRLHFHDDRLQIETPAKVNLFLEVLGKRSDGYHELESVMLSVGLFDTLSFSRPPHNASDIQLSITSPAARRAGTENLNELPLDGRNLIVRAAELIRQETGYAGGVQIALTKRIPMEAGLGGGSSDAAATLVGLNRFWDLGLSSAELHRLAAQLGSDVNFFLDSVPVALCRGRGEQIEPARLDRRWFGVIFKPTSGLSTAAVFRRWQPGEELRSGSEFLEEFRKGRLGEIARGLHNSLQLPATALNLEVAEILYHLRGEQCIGTLMSGSGSACFALCHNRSQALRVAAKLRAKLAVRIDVVETTA